LARLNKLTSSISKTCREIARLLAVRSWKVVFAESCTAGYVSASLARVPGISNCLCGSAVTYRNATKAKWLKISASDLADPGPVSELVTARMARQVLANTPEADLAAAVTGHLGPQAPRGWDGVIFIATAIRGRGKRTMQVVRHTLRSRTRTARQREAARLVLEALHDVLG
jgi:PncC family amidohydrolase